MACNLQVVALLVLFALVRAQEPPPASFTLFNDVLMASSVDTCGNLPEVYFDPVANENRMCNATDHPPSDALNNNQASWWQSKGGAQVYEVISVQLRMGNSYMPRDFVLEKRIEDGSYVPLEYVVDDPATRCLSVFGVNEKESFAPSDPADVVLCHGPTDTNPSAGGDSINIDFVFTGGTLRPGAIGHVREFVDFTSTRMLRLRFMGFVSDARAVGAEFFAVADLRITGRCSCNGFAFTCTEPTLANPVYQCDCTPSSRTDGASCDRCQALFNNASYVRAFDDPSFVCQECDCSEAADTCAYNPTLARGVCTCTNPQGCLSCEQCFCYGHSHLCVHDEQRGCVCVDCEHNTTGDRCEKCLPDFFRDPGKDPNDPTVCLRKCGG